MITKGQTGSMFNLGEYEMERRNRINAMDIGMSGTICTLGAWGRHKKKLDLCKEIGNEFGMFFVENGKYYIDNFDEVFKYNTCNELLFDWLDTLIESDEATGTDTWKDAIEFIKNLQ